METKAHYRSSVGLDPVNSEAESDAKKFILDVIDDAIKWRFPFANYDDRSALRTQRDRIAKFLRLPKGDF